MDFQIDMDLIDPTEQDDIIAEGMYMRQKEFMNYQMELKNIELMLASAPDEHKEEIQQRIEFIKKQMEIVVTFHNGLKSQIRSPEAHAAAIERTAAKRKAREDAQFGPK